MLHLLHNVGRMESLGMLGGVHRCKVHLSSAKLAAQLPDRLVKAAATAAQHLMLLKDN